MAALVGVGTSPASGTSGQVIRWPDLSPCLYHLDMQKNLGALKRGEQHPHSPHYPTLLDSEGLGMLEADKRTECPRPACQASRRGLCLSQAAGRLLEDMESAL